MLERQLPEPQTKVKIENDRITNVGSLLVINSLSRDDFKKVLCINLDKICRVLHTDVNNSCFSLRMMLYQNFVGILEEIVTFIDQDKIIEFLNYLVRPLNQGKTEGLNIQRTNASQRDSKQVSSTLEVEEAMNAIQRQNQYLGHNEGRM